MQHSFCLPDLCDAEGDAVVVTRWDAQRIGAPPAPPAPPHPLPPCRNC